MGATCFRAGTVGGLTPPGQEPGLHTLFVPHTAVPFSFGTSQTRFFTLLTSRHPSQTNLPFLRQSLDTQILCSWHLGLELSLITGFSDRDRGPLMHFRTPHSKPGGSTPHSAWRDVNTLAASKQVLGVPCVAGCNPNLLQGFKYPLESQFPSLGNYTGFFFWFGLFSGFLFIFC